jgi:hypothetical protein
MVALNSLIIDKDYSVLADDMQIEYMKPVSEFGLTETFYGGNVNHIAKLKDSPFFLLMDTLKGGLQIRDVAVKSLEEIDYNVLRKYAAEKNITEKQATITKVDLIEKIKKVALTFDSVIPVA